MIPTYCYHCGGGKHGDCTLSYCACPMDECARARRDESWVKYSVRGAVQSLKGRLVSNRIG